MADSKPDSVLAFRYDSGVIAVMPTADRPVRDESDIVIEWYDDESKCHDDLPRLALSLNQAILLEEALRRTILRVTGDRIQSHGR